jgi:NIMA (never in mitosis gene a)-related kinase
MDNYDLKEVIRFGKFGVVQKAIKKLDGQIVSIQMIDITKVNPDLATSEVKTLRQLDHQNVVKYFDSFQHEKYFCIVMEFCNGKTMKELIQEQKSPFKESYILNFFFQMVNVLKYCQDKNIMHGDLKPENITISANNQIKIIGLEVAKILASSNFASTYSSLPYYMSPELFQGKKYSFASDLWSMGVIVYEMMTFKRLFEANTLEELKQKVLKEDFSVFSLLYSADLIEVVQRLLSKTPFTRISINKLLKHPTLWKSNNIEVNDDKKVKLLEIELSQQKEDIQKLQSTIQQLEILKPEIKKLQKENQKQNDDIQNIQLENQQQNIEIQNIQKENQKQKAGIQTIQTKNQKQNADIQNIQKENQTFQKEIENLKKKLQNIQRENQSQKNKIQNLQAKDQNLEEKIQKQKKKLQNLQTKNHNK